MRIQNAWGLIHKQDFYNQFFEVQATLQKKWQKEYKGKKEGELVWMLFSSHDPGMGIINFQHLCLLTWGFYKSLLIVVYISGRILQDLTTCHWSICLEDTPLGISTVLYLESSKWKQKTYPECEWHYLIEWMKGKKKWEGELNTRHLAKLLKEAFNYPWIKTLKNVNNNFYPILNA